MFLDFTLRKRQVRIQRRGGYSMPKSKIETDYNVKIKKDTV